jgi:Carboxypeptidase regulatory-like domain
MNRVVLLLSALALIGCGKSDQTASTPPAPPAPSQSVATGSGEITGRIFFDAPAPNRKVVSTPDNWARVLDETVVVNPNGTLRNVLVYLKDAPIGNGGGDPVVLDQIDCHYVPHVIGLQVGQALVIRNGEHHMHNIHLRCAVNQEMNFALMDVSEHEPIIFKAPEFFKIACDVHPWMDAEVGVFDHPYFAVTGDDGSFAIHHVPSGNYTLAARHELYGELTQSVTVGEKQTASVDFRYKPPLP